jgi:hypothetical protein
MSRKDFLAMMQKRKPPLMSGERYDGPEQREDYPHADRQSSRL